MIKKFLFCTFTPKLSCKRDFGCNVAYVRMYYLYPDLYTIFTTNSKDAKVAPSDRFLAKTEDDKSGLYTSSPLYCKYLPFTNLALRDLRYYTYAYI